VHHGARLDFEELQQTAHRLLKESDYTQQEMADRLDVSRISVARAVTEPGSKFQRLQMRIVEALTDYEVERFVQVEFRIWDNDAASSENGSSDR
jgi:DNA-binding transcriptional regulator LsrR (DeoR family)